MMLLNPPGVPGSVHLWHSLAFCYFERSARCDYFLRANIRPNTMEVSDPQFASSTFCALNFYFCRKVATTILKCVKTDVLTSTDLHFFMAQRIRCRAMGLRRALILFPLCLAIFHRVVGFVGGRQTARGTGRIARRGHGGPAVKEAPGEEPPAVELVNFDVYGSTM